MCDDYRCRALGVGYAEEPDPPRDAWPSLADELLVEALPVETVAAVRRVLAARGALPVHLVNDRAAIAGRLREERMPTYKAGWQKGYQAGYRVAERVLGPPRRRGGR